MRVIKRHRNRRLYDTSERRTITHERLRELIQQGVQYQIIDNASGRDVTVETLGRLLVTESAGWPAAAPLKGQLEQLIVQGGELSMSILRNTVLASIGAFNVTKKKAEEIIDKLIESGELTKSQRKEAVLELVEKADKHTEEFRQKILQQANKVGADVNKAVEKLKVARQDDVDKLNKKFDKLLKAVERLEKKMSTGA
ncbi:MAG TPA: polyhydroxyalkanoate synthesis regulator DNA-binding domain-containing protein [candidate division Zixibacteria bacterium]|nr:polyhydroxyalkanoate synthesis regulator DNA-binding domain-containing protein [candidate division Zixibacteria bacterium]